MEREIEEKVNRVLDYIEKDRIIPVDHFFSTRLSARTDHYFAIAKKKSFTNTAWVSLRPILAICIIFLGIFAGIFSGIHLNRMKPAQNIQERSARIEQFANESFIPEFSNPVEEQILSK